MTALTDSLAEGAIQAILEAGELLTDPADVQSIRSKGETDYVTNVDVAVQAFLRERLVALAPDVQFMGEEQDNTGLDWSRPYWILDPVDGTTNLIHSFRHSAISLALAEDGQTAFGVVYNPYTEECFTARRGGGALRNGVPIHVSDVSRLEDSLLSTGPSQAAGSWRMRLSGRCGCCMTGVRTCVAPVAPAWTCAGWPADGWTAMWSCLSSPGTTPPECASRRRPGEKSPPPTAAPYPSGRAGLCWPLTGGSTARCKQF